MEPYQKRILVEEKELDTKIKKLGDFINMSPDYDALSEEEKVRLTRQFWYMRDYSFVLRERIDAFDD